MKFIHKYRFWLILTLIIHILVSYTLKGGKRSESQGAKGKGSVEKSSLSKEDKKAIAKILDEDFKDFIAKQKEGKIGKLKVKISGDIPTYKKSEQSSDDSVKDKCEEDSYVGVGIRHYNWGIVSDVAKGYAADRAGVKIGDEIMGFFEHSNPSKFIEGVEIRGKVGTGVDLYIKRDGKMIRLSMIREKICYSKLSSP